MWSGVRQSARCKIDPKQGSPQVLSSTEQGFLWHLSPLFLSWCTRTKELAGAPWASSPNFPKRSGVQLQLLLGSACSSHRRHLLLAAPSPRRPLRRWAGPGVPKEAFKGLAVSVGEAGLWARRIALSSVGRACACARAVMLENRLPNTHRPPLQT